MSRRRRNETEEQRARRELISDFLSVANIQSMDDIQELFKEALAGFMEGSLESELDDELGYEPYDVKNKETDNSRNGHSKKTLRTSMGKVDIEVPRDRNGKFEPKILPIIEADVDISLGSVDLMLLEPFAVSEEHQKAFMIILECLRKKQNRTSE